MRGVKSAKVKDLYSGASATYAVTETDGAQAGAQIKFNLLGARLFLGLPLDSFATRSSMRRKLLVNRQRSREIGSLRRAR